MDRQSTSPPNVSHMLCAHAGVHFSEKYQSFHHILKFLCAAEEQEWPIARYTKVSKDFKDVKRWRNMVWVGVYLLQPFSEKLSNSNENVNYTHLMTR